MGTARAARCHPQPPRLSRLRSCWDVPSTRALDRPCHPVLLRCRATCGSPGGARWCCTFHTVTPVTLALLVLLTQVTAPPGCALSLSTPL